jgi:hypothetical protein
MTPAAPGRQTPACAVCGAPGRHARLLRETRSVQRLDHLHPALQQGRIVGIHVAEPFDHPRDGRRLLDRGAEFLAFRGDLICEVRAYYNERGGDLAGFDHAGRGHTTL